MKKNVGVKLYDLGLEKSVVSQLLHQSTSEKNKNRFVGLHQNQKLSFCVEHDREREKTICGMKGYICKPQKGLVSSTYEELLNSVVKRLIVQLKMGKDLNKPFSKEDKQMANKCIESCSTSLVIRKMPVKITMSYHLKPIRTV